MTKNEIRSEMKRLVVEKTTKKKARLLYKSGTRALVEAWEAQGRPWGKEPAAVAYYDRYRVILHFWMENDCLKQEIRSHQLALAFARGRRYWVAERFAKETPNVEHVATLLGVSKDVIEAWVAQTPSQEEAAAYQAHVDAAKARAREMKAAKAVQRGRAA